MKRVIFQVVLPLFLLLWVHKSYAQDTSSQQAVTFDVWEFRVEGNSLLPDQTLERVLYPFLGQQKRIEDMEAARQALEQQYHNDGYAAALVNIPEQEVNAGLVTLEVIEGKISRVKITGSRYFLLKSMREKLPALAEGSVLYLPAVQSELAALNAENPDLALSPVLRPGATPGTVEIELKVKDQMPLHGSLDLNDRHSANTSRLRLTASLRYDNLWQRQHGVSLQYQTSPEQTDEVQVFSGTYLYRPEKSGNIMALYAVRSESNVSVLGSMTVLGKGDIGGVRWIMPFAADGNYFHSLSLGADYKDFKESLTLQGSDALNTPIDYAVFSAMYTSTYRREKSLTQFGIGANFGIRGLTDDTVECEIQDEQGQVVVAQVNEFECKRLFSRANFLYLRANVNHTQSLYRNFSATIRLDAQIADSPLISNEQFGAGGADSVRGYFESQVLGDDGFIGGIELATPNLRLEKWSHLQTWHAYLFMDGAKLTTQDPLPGENSKQVISSRGIGMRLTAWKHVNSTIEWANMLKDAGEVKTGDERFLFRVEYTF